MNIFVFGSNTQGRHGAGAALFALQHYGAKYGQARGLQGESYAIVTKELRPNYPPITLESIGKEIAIFKQFASSHPTWIFKVTRIGSGLAGFQWEDILSLFGTVPDNVKFI